MRGTGSTGGVSVEWGAVTDVGRARSVNEDAVLAEPSVFVIADGMGGHRAGDVASALVVDRFAMLAGDRLRAMDEVVDVIGTVNAVILEHGRIAEERSGMGATAVGLLLVDNGARPSFLVFNIGDSRAYCLAEGQLEQLSVDHSYVQELIDAGQLSVAAAREHPQRNVVTRALGVDELPRADYWLRPPATGERYLLCSDGLNSEVGDNEIREVLAAPTNAEQAAAELVRRALEAGGRDNVSVLVLDVLEVDEDEVSLSDTAPKGLIANVVGGAPPGVGRASDPEAVEIVEPLLDVGAVPGGSDPDHRDEQPDIEGFGAAGVELIEAVPPEVVAASTTSETDAGASQEDQPGSIAATEDVDE